MNDQLLMYYTMLMAAPADQEGGEVVAVAAGCGAGRAVGAPSTAISCEHTGSSRYYMDYFAALLKEPQHPTFRDHGWGDGRTDGNEVTQDVTGDGNNVERYRHV